VLSTLRKTSSGLIPALSCRNCRPQAPFAELVKLSPRSIADEMREGLRARQEAAGSYLGFGP
jgi:hypothetical protein